MITTVLFTVRPAAGTKSYAVRSGRHSVIFTGNFKTSTSRMRFMHKHQRVCINFCCSPSIDSQLVCRLVRLTFKCQAHRLSAAFGNILKGYTGEWNLKQLGVIPKDPQSKSWFVPPQGKIARTINISEKKQKRMLNIKILRSLKHKDTGWTWTSLEKRLAYLQI